MYQETSHDFRVKFSTLFQGFYYASRDLRWRWYSRFYIANMCKLAAAEVSIQSSITGKVVDFSDR